MSANRRSTTVIWWRSSGRVRVIRLVDDAPGAVVLDKREIVAEVGAAELGAVSDEHRVPLERHSIDTQVVFTRVACAFHAFGDVLLSRLPLQLAFPRADDAGSRVERAGEFGFVTGHRPVVIGTYDVD